MPKLPTHSSYTDEIYKTEKNRNYLVVQQNRLVQNTCFTMPLVYQKVLACLIRSIKPHQKSLKLRFSVSQYMHLLGLRWSGSSFEEIAYVLKHISDKSFYMEQKDHKYHLWRWIKDVTADPNGKGRGDFVVTFNDYMKPYLFNPELRNKTIFKFSDIMLMRSRYSPRLYEIFKSNRSRQKIQKRGLNYSLIELKKALDLVYRNKYTHRVKHDKNGRIKFKYPRYYEFKRHILLPAFREINTFTEYNVHFTPLTKGRKTIGINVVMNHKNKTEIRHRDDRIFFITHHIPKSQWATWREDTIRGKFHQVKPRNTKPKRIIDGKYKIVKHSDSTPTKEDLKRIDDYLDKHKVPFKEVNMSGNRIKYYSPLYKRYMWTTYYMRKKQEKIYNAKKQMDKALEKHKQDRERGRV